MNLSELSDFSDESSDDDKPIQGFQRRRRWGRYPPSKTAACDQHPIGITRGEKTWDFKGVDGIFIREAKKCLDKRQFTLHMTYFAEEPGNYPRFLPVCCFKGQPDGYDEEDSDWEGDVEVAPGLHSTERDGYDERVHVIYSKKAWMGKQQCTWYVNKLLEEVGDDCILLQCDGYESLLNAIESEDKDGKIFELISPGNCSDICSMPDCEVGAFLVRKVNNYFDNDFDLRPNDYVDGKVTAKDLRCKFTHWVADAVADLYENHKPMILRAFQKCGIMIDLDGYDKHKIQVPNFQTYKPPDKEEEYREEPYTEEELKEFEKNEKDWRIQEKKKKQQKRKAEQIKRNLKRAKLDL